MEQLNLSPRLLSIAKAVMPGLAAADVGMDHALLSFYLLQKGIVPRVVGIELSDGPYQRALKAIVCSPWKEQIDLRQGNGLEPLNPGEVGNVIIAGLGGDNISEILSMDWEKAESFKHYILQPMSRGRVVRETLARRGWPILHEYLVREEEKYFIIIATGPGSKPYTLSSLQADLGLAMLDGREGEVLSYLELALKKYKNIIYGYKLAGYKVYDSRYVEIQSKIVELEEIICRQK